MSSGSLKFGCYFFKEHVHLLEFEDVEKKDVAYTTREEQNHKARNLLKEIAG